MDSNTTRTTWLGVGWKKFYSKKSKRKLSNDHLISTISNNSFIEREKDRISIKIEETKSSEKKREINNEMEKEMIEKMKEEMSVETSEGINEEMKKKMMEGMIVIIDAIIVRVDGANVTIRKSTKGKVEVREL